jgi:hypothetical protein
MSLTILLKRPRAGRAVLCAPRTARNILRLKDGVHGLSRHSRATAEVTRPAWLRFGWFGRLGSQERPDSAVVVPALRADVKPQARPYSKSGRGWTPNAIRRTCV